jgi:hypothetical protein
LRFSAIFLRRRLLLFLFLFVCLLSHMCGSVTQYNVVLTHM